MVSALRRVARQRGTPTLVAALFLGVATTLCLIMFMTPEMIRSGGWRWLYAGVIAFLGVASVVVLRLRRLPDSRVLPAVLAVDVVIVIGAACLTDRDAGRVCAALFALPTLFLALYAGIRTMVPQTVAVLVGTIVVVALGGPLDVVAVNVTLCLLVAVFTPVAAVAVLRARLAEALREARTLSSTDPLTGLLNRRGLSERAPGVVVGARDSGRPIGVVVADIDHFKRVNDRYGHATGDEVLKTVARAVASCVRPDDLVVRLGGEEMVVVTAVGPHDLIDLAERIRHRVGAASELYPVTVSLGVAWSDDNGPRRMDPAELVWSLVDEADDLMYAAKRDGRNRVHSSPAVH